MLSPRKPQHGLQRGQFVQKLIWHARASGEATVEFAVETEKRVKVPDVVWISEDRLEQLPEEAEASPILPEIVVEVLSEENTETVLAEKQDLYFDEGAREV
jgi:Uma2 family endonuclease